MPIYIEFYNIYFLIVGLYSSLILTSKNLYMINYEYFSMTLNPAWIMLCNVLVFAFACADCLINQINFTILCYSLNLIP